MNTATIAQQFLSIVTQLRVFHWSTTSYAQHVAFGGAYDSLSDTSDKFVETMIGTYGRPGIIKPIVTTELSDAAVTTFLRDTTAFLEGLTNQLIPLKDSDLLNMRDEMLGTVNHLKYLLTLS